MKNKKKIGIIAICSVCAVAVTYALFTTTFSVGNKFKINDVKAEFVEEFNPPKEGEIVAGNTYEKSGKVINNNDVPVKARAKISISWLDNAGNIILDNSKPTGNLGANEYAYTLNFGDTVSQADAKKFQTKLSTNGDKFDVSTDTPQATDMWVYDENDDYFYYKGKNGVIPAKIVHTSSVSSPLLKSISFNKNLALTKTDNYYYVKDDPNKQPYTSQEDAKKHDTNGAGIVYKETSTITYPDYKDKTLVVTLSGEVIDADSTWK